MLSKTAQAARLPQPAALVWLDIPQARPNVGFYAASMFVASATQIRRHPLAAYVAMHAKAAGGDGRCHHGTLEWHRLHWKPSNGSGEHLLDSPGMSKHTIAGTWEHLHHVLVGGLYRGDEKSIRNGESLYAPYAFDFCTAFYEDCPLSPCNTYLQWVQKTQRPGDKQKGRGRGSRKRAKGGPNDEQ